MFFNILKKDLKRKKVMNIILLLFIILSSMFVASSVNNISTVSSSLDNYFEEANAPDYFAATIDKSSVEPIENVLDNIKEIDSYGIEHILYGSSDNILYNEEPLESINNTTVVMSFDDRKINYFNTNNKIINEIEKGKVLVSGKFLKKNDLKIGDKLQFVFGDKKIELELAGSFKDAVLGSDMMGMFRFLLNDEDYNVLKESNMYNDYSGCLLYIKTNDIRAIDQALGEGSSNVIFNGSISMVRTTYVMDMVIAGVLLVVSVCLILIAFVVLSFTISFTLTEEYREIGVMKAIGIKNNKIRLLYLIKYFTLAVIGSILGLIISIPFGNMLLKSVSEVIVMKNDNLVVINILCSIIVVIIIMLFSYLCTRKVKKYSPVDAIRSGTTGERFNKKSALKLSKSKIKPAGFMAINDVLSSPKRFIIIKLIYGLCLLLLLVIVNTVNTLKSGSLVNNFGITQSDVYYLNDAKQMTFIKENGKEEIIDYIDDIKNTLKKNDMEAKCIIEIIYKLSLSYNDNSYKSQTIQGINTTTDMYNYYKGTAPQNINEIAITPLISEKLAATIGDTVTIHLPTGDQEFIITGLFQSMNNQGEGVRIHEDLEIDMIHSSGSFAFQINFNDECSDNEIKNRIRKLKEIFPEGKFQTASEYVETMVGVVDTLNSVKVLIIAVVIVVVMLVTVLMELSFITKEKSEIAILKAMGFKEKTIIKWHALRFVLVTIIAAILAILLSYPATYLAITPIFKMMGAYFGIKYEINLIDICLIYPLIILTVSIISAIITALYSNKIKASDASSIE